MSSSAHTAEGALPHLSPIYCMSGAREDKIEMTEHPVPQSHRKEFDMKDRDPYLINQHLTVGQCRSQEGGGGL